MKIPLLTSGTTAIGVDGRATIQLGPQVFGTVWTVERSTVSSTSALQTGCVQYRNVESPTAQVDATSNGNNDTNDSELTVSYGQSLLFVWSGGTPGASVTATLGGWSDTGR